MIAKIKTGAKFYGAARYNQQKVDQNQAKVLYQSGFLNTNPQTIADTLHYVSGFRVKKPVFHASLSFAKADKDRLDDEKMVELAREYMDRMGGGDLPTPRYGASPRACLDHPRERGNPPQNQGSFRGKEV